MVMPTATASRRSGRRVRAEILRSGALDEIVALPAGLASSHTLGVHLWILTRPSAGHIDDDGEVIGQVQPARSVRMTDASGFDRERLRQLEGNWWREFCDEPGVTADIPVIDLLDDDVDLTPSRYVHYPEANLAADLHNVLGELAPLVKSLADQPARQG